MHRSLLLASDGAAAIPKVSFGWVLSTFHGQRLLHVSGPPFGAHSNSCRAEGHGILLVMQLVYRVQGFVTGPVSESWLGCDSKIIVESTHQVPEEY